MKILIIGSAGNIGSKLVPFLKSLGHEVYECDIKQDHRKNYTVIDIVSPTDLFGVFKKFAPDVVFNLAAMVSRVTCESSPELTISTNVSGLNNVIQLCKYFNSKLISFSTSEVYGNIGGVLREDRELKPNNIYGLSKMLGEELVKYEVKNGLKAIIVRPFMFYDEDETLGAHRSAMIRFAESLIKKQKITVHKDSGRSWLHIRDGVKILEKLIHIEGFTIVNIAHPKVVDTDWIAYKMCDILGLRYTDHVIETELPGKMTLMKYPDITRQSKLTGIIPEIDIEEGIILVLNKVKQRLNDKCNNSCCL